jgi:hypothetical protein
MITVTHDARRRIDYLLTDHHVDLAVRLASRRDGCGFRVEMPAGDDAVVSWGTGCLAVEPALCKELDGFIVDADSNTVLGLQIIFVA